MTTDLQDDMRHDHGNHTRMLLCRAPYIKVYNQSCQHKAKSMHSYVRERPRSTCQPQHTPEAVQVEHVAAVQLLVESLLPTQLVTPARG